MCYDKGLDSEGGRYHAETISAGVQGKVFLSIQTERLIGSARDTK